MAENSLFVYLLYSAEMQTYGQEGAQNTDTELSHVLHHNKHQAAFYVKHS